MEWLLGSLSCSLPGTGEGRAAMSTYRHFKQCLDIVAEGAFALPEVAQAAPLSSFALQSMGAELEAVPAVELVKQRRAAGRAHRKAMPWVYARGVQGLGIGAKESDGHVSDDLSLKVYVDRKRPLSQVKQPVPRYVETPAAGKLRTDVEEIGQLESELFTSRVRPAMPGCGLGHVKVTVGTFGCLVKRRGDAKTLYVLSNSHVLANSGNAKVGDKIIQGGKSDGGAPPADVIGTLADFVPFDFATDGFPNLVDAAIAKVAKKDVVTAIRVLGHKPKGVSSYVRRGMHVQKVGRTTDHTLGIIKDIDFRLRIRYRAPDGKKRRAGLRDQVLCSRYTAGGDSGAAVLNHAGKLIGLHFAGSPSSSVFNKIDNVLAALDIRLA